jgi:hypothetical protein
MVQRKKKGKGSEERRYGGQRILDLVDRGARQAGRGVRFLPLTHWDRRAMFVGAKDKYLSHFTGGRFAKGSQGPAGTHPLFVLERVANLAHRVCPCSSQAYSNLRYIEQGCVLRHTSYVVAQRTYLVEHCSFQVPQDRGFLWGLRYWGRVPEDCLGEVE